MPKGDNPKHKEHHIPRMYLDRFSVHGVDKPVVWQYDLKNKHMSPGPVPTDSVCFENDLYEFKDAQGHFLYQNRIENNLAPVEGGISAYFRKIDSKALENRNLATKCFLSKEEKGALLLFIAMHLSRIPETLKEAEKLIPQFYGTSMSDVDRSNLSKFFCMELFVNPKKQIDETSLFGKWCSMLLDMGFIIYRAPTPVLFTSNQFLQLYPPATPIIVDGLIHPESVAFPLSPTLFVYMCKKNKMNTGMKNNLVEMSEKLIAFVQERIVEFADRWIYSCQPFTEDQIMMFKDIQKKKQINKFTSNNKGDQT